MTGPWYGENEGSVLQGEGLARGRLLLKPPEDGQGGVEQLVSYRLQALRAIWGARLKAGEEKEEGPGKAAVGDHVKEVDLSRRLPLLLLLPLLRCQAQVTPGLQEEVAALLLHCLEEVQEEEELPKDWVQELTSLLASWLANSPQPVVASALVALACSHPRPQTLVTTLHLLATLSLPELPVVNLLQRLSRTRCKEQGREEEEESANCSLDQVRHGLALHLGHLASLALAGPNLAPVPDQGHLARLLDLLERAGAREESAISLVLLAQLQVDLRSVGALQGDLGPRLEALLWPLLEGNEESVMEATRHTMLASLPYLWPSPAAQSSLALHLLQGNQYRGRKLLLHLLLDTWTDQLTKGRKQGSWRNQELQQSLLLAVSQEGLTSQTEDKLLQETKDTTHAPLHFLGALQGKLMASLLLQETQEQDGMEQLESWCHHVFSCCHKVLQEMQAVMQENEKNKAAQEEEKEVPEELCRLATDIVGVQLDLLGELVLPLLTWLTDPSLEELCRALAPALVTLLLEAHSVALQARPGAKEGGLLSGLTLPQPWKDTQPLILPVLTDITLTLSLVTTRALNTLYQGGKQGEQELACLQLLQSPLLHHLPLEPALEVIQDERTGRAGWSLPVVRPSLESLLQVERLRSGLEGLVEGLEEEAARAAGERLAALLRGLQAGAELEARWKEEVEQVATGQLECKDSFFTSYSQAAGQGKELTRIATLVTGHFDLEKPEKSISELILHMEEEAKGGSEGRGQILTKTAALVIAMVERLEQLVAANPSSTHLAERAARAGVEPARLVELIFSFLESPQPSGTFLELVAVREKRAEQRLAALSLVQTLLEVPAHLEVAAAVLSRGPGTGQLGSEAGQLVLSVWGTALSGLVQQVALRPPGHLAALAKVCAAPCEGGQEVASSGLVSLLSSLCEEGKEGREVWACISSLVSGCQGWREDGQLVGQVSSLLTNCLNLAQERKDAAGFKDVLLLIDRTSGTPLGQQTLATPRCCSLLLSCSLSPTLPPGQWSIVTRLLAISLPLLPPSTLYQVSLPPPYREGTVQEGLTRLLLARLAACLLPPVMRQEDRGAVQELRPEGEDSMEKTEAGAQEDGQGEGQERGGAYAQDPERRLALFLHKREDEAAHEVIQQLLTATLELRLLRLTGSQSMERIVTMDRELVRSHKTEVVSDDATVILRRAVKLAQGGLLVSVGPSVRQGAGEGEQLAQQVARERNSQLVRHDMVRPFVSSSVAATMAAEQVSLLHSLLAQPPWATPLLHHLVTVVARLPGIAGGQWLYAVGEADHFSTMLERAQECLACISCLRFLPPALHTPQLRTEVARALGQLLWPTDGSAGITEHLPLQGDTKGMVLTAGRVVAELRTTSLELLACWCRELEFATIFRQTQFNAVAALSSLADDCLPSDRSAAVVAATQSLRSVYRDTARPPAPPSGGPGDRRRATVWDISRSHPPLRSLLLTHGMLGITYYSEGGSAAGQPKGALVYGNHPVTSGSYWELEVLSLGEGEPPSDTSSSPLLSVGLAPSVSRPEGEPGAWTYPVGSVVYHSSGRVIHYSGPTLLSWRSLRFDCLLQAGDCLGLGWEGATDSPGTVFFTLNGVRLDQALEQVRPGLFPVVHLQRKGTRVRANFGSGPFRYKVKTVAPPPVRGRQLAPADTKVTQRDLGGGQVLTRNHGGRSVQKPAPLQEYRTGRAGEEQGGLAHGPEAVIGASEAGFKPLDDDSDSDEESNNDEEEAEESGDVNRLLVKAWESKVFPIIRRRFRNDTERQDGLEQIRGALSLGMADIARQTVEFLYEDTGGVPRDLLLPGLEEMKEQQSLLQLHLLRRGQEVLVRREVLGTGDIVTLGLLGKVLEVDQTAELVMVETYLAEEGRLVRFWYPLASLERPTASTSGNSVTRLDLLSPDLHKQLLAWEAASTRVAGREAVLALQEVCGQSPRQPTSLALLSSSLLLCPDSGDLLERRLSAASPDRVLELGEGRASALFYHRPAALVTRLEQEILGAVKEGSLDDLTSELCASMHHAPAGFTTQEIEICDSSQLRSTLHFPGACAVFASVRLPEDVSSQEDVTIQLQLPDPGQVARAGQLGNRQCVQWPRGPGGLASAWGPALLATDTLRVSHSGGEGQGVILVLQGIPSSLPLALLYMETLATLQGSLVAPAAFQHCLTYLSRLLSQYACPALLREHLLLLLAELLRSARTAPEPLQALLCTLRQELVALHTWEAGQGLGRYSGYQQALVEVCLAVSEVTGTSLPESWFLEAVQSTRLLRRLVKGGEDAWVTELWSRAVRERCSARDWERVVVVVGPQHLAQQQLLEEVAGVLGPLGRVWGEAQGEADNTVLVQVRSSAVLERALSLLSSSPLLAPGSEDMAGATLLPVGPGYMTGQPPADRALHTALRAALQGQGRDLASDCYNALEDIFLSCYLIGLEDSEEDESGEEDCIALTQKQILTKDGSNLLLIFLTSLQPGGREDWIVEVMAQYGEAADREPRLDSASKEGRGGPSPRSKVSLEGFLRLVAETIERDVTLVWSGLHAAGFDLEFERTPTQASFSSWSLEQDASLIGLLDSLASSLSVPPSALQPYELRPSREELRAHPELQGKPLEQVRARHALLAAWNHGLEAVLPLLDLRGAQLYPHSTAATLRRGRGLVHFTTKRTLLSAVLNSSVQRGPDLAAPEVTMDPVAELGGGGATLLSRTLHQLSCLPSHQLCVALASGADPIYPFTVRMADQEVVEGTAGSFRHLMAGVVAALPHPSLGLLTPGPGALYFLAPGGPVGSMQGLGQLLGVGLRAGLPLALPLQPAVWRALVGEETGWGEAGSLEPATLEHLATLEQMGELEWQEEPTTWTFPSVTGRQVELVAGGKERQVAWEERGHYCTLVRQLRVQEWAARDQVDGVMAGLATIAPLTLLRHLFTPAQLEVQLCGLARVELAFLRRHTMYLAGLQEEDPHIRLFWSVLAGFTQDQLGRLVKFACNQDRILTSSSSSSPPPPLPMKLGPPDQDGEDQDQDSQLVRAETCVFLIKLPRYSSYHVMRTRLLLSLSCALDPLSG